MFESKRERVGGKVSIDCTQSRELIGAVRDGDSGGPSVYTGR